MEEGSPQGIGCLPCRALYGVAVGVSLPCPLTVPATGGHTTSDDCSLLVLLLTHSLLGMVSFDTLWLPLQIGLLLFGLLVFVSVITL